MLRCDFSPLIITYVIPAPVPVCYAQSWGVADYQCHTTVVRNDNILSLGQLQTFTPSALQAVRVNGVLDTLLYITWGGEEVTPSACILTYRCYSVFAGMRTFAISQNRTLSLITLILSIVPSGVVAVCFSDILRQLPLN